MKELEIGKNNVAAAIGHPHTVGIARKNKGITLIALIITIVVMLILVIVSVRIAMETGLFESAGKATKDWGEAQDKEAELSSGKVNIGGTVYNSIEEYTNSISGGNAEVDFEKLFATAEKHPEQTMSNDIGIAEDGSIVNLDLWIYVLTDDERGWDLHGSSYEGYTSYDEKKIVDGKIIGQVPMFIKQAGENTFYPVTEMKETFYGCDTLVTAPSIPSSVTDMYETFSNCKALTKTPIIPDSVTNMENAFWGCTSLTEVQNIPSSVIDMSHTFSDCTALTKVPVIPESVMDMRSTFLGCTSLTGTLTIEANPDWYGECLEGAATAEGCNLVLNGSSTVLNEILETAEENPNITIGN